MQSWDRELGSIEYWMWQALAFRISLPLILRLREPHMKLRPHQHFWFMLIAVAGFVMPCTLTAQHRDASLGDDPGKYVAFAQSIYWQALTPDEKQTFLFAYIASAYEVRKMANDMIMVEARRAHEFNEKVDWFFTVWQDLLAMEDSDDGSMEEFIGWIDLYYHIDFNRTRPFHEALAYAHQKTTSGDRAILDLFWGQEPPPGSPLSEDDAAQKAIQRRIAASEAHQSIDAAGDLLATDSLPATPAEIVDFTDEEERLIQLAVETECLNKSDPESLRDPEFLEELAQRFQFDSMADFNARFRAAQEAGARWEAMNKEIIERAFDRQCM